MKPAEIKLDFFRKIDGLSEHQLKEAYGMFLNYLNSSKKIDHWAQLDKEEKAAIENGLSQIQEGKVTPHEKVMARLRKKYSKCQHNSLLSVDRYGNKPNNLLE